MSKICYPIYFTKNICVHCGVAGSLFFVDKFGNETKNPIYPIESMKCRSCGTIFNVRWVNKNENEEKMIPSCTGDYIKKEFEEKIIEFALSNRRKLL